MLPGAVPFAGTVEDLGARLSSRDAARFIGRRNQLAFLESLLVEDPVANVVLLHGPGGVGKSALMRAFGRLAQSRGWAPLTLDARSLMPVSEQLERALSPALDARRPLILLDSWEQMASLDSHLRAELLPKLPRQALVVLATRRSPGPEWFSGGWEHIALELPLKPLNALESDALLRARGIESPAARAAAVDWSHGSPLALVLAAGSGGVPEDLPPEEGPPGVVERLLSHLLGAQPEGEQREVLAVAALAHVTTPELLQVALPQLDPAQAYAWLREHPCAERLEEGVTLHELLARALRADLRQRSPALERELRRRLADALYARAISGGFLQLTRDLQHLVQDPAIRWGFAWDTSGRYRIDAPRRSDLEAIAARGGRAALAWLEAARPYFLGAPERVTIVRGEGDSPAGYGIAVTPANAPSFAAGDPVLGPRLRHAAQHMPDGAAVIWRQAVDLTREPSSPVTALLGMAGVIASGLGNPAAAYLPIARGDTTAQAFSAACGAAPVPQLAVEQGGLVVECHVLDYGPGGLLANQRAAVYRELGLAPPPEPPRTVTLDAVRQALRRYGSPALLAGSVIIPGGGSPAERAGLARAMIDRAVQEAFGDSPGDRRLRQILTRAYLEPAGTHELAAVELGLSRTAYFRRLRIAVERVALYLGAAGDPAPTARSASRSASEEQRPGANGANQRPPSKRAAQRSARAVG